MNRLKNSFEASLIFVRRHLLYSSGDSNHWVVILSPQSMKELRILHDSPLIMSTEEGLRAFVRVHSSAEYGLEFSSLSHPKSIITEELAKSLNLKFDVKTTVMFSQATDIYNASKLCLKFMESYDHRDNLWKFNISSNDSCMEDNSVKSNPLDRKLGNFKSDSIFEEFSKKCNIKTNETNVSANICNNVLNWYNITDNSKLYPPVEWYNSLMNKEFNQVVKSSLLGSVLFQNNIISLNLNGYLSRFFVYSINKSSNTTRNTMSIDSGNRNIPLSVNNETEIEVIISEKVITGFKFDSELSDRNDEKSSIISGMDEIIEMFNTHVIMPLVLDLDVGHPSGVLLYGPPGCGKTLLARRIATNYKKLFNLCSYKDKMSSNCTEMKVRLVQSTDLISEFMGKTERNITELFQSLREDSKTSKVICFIDEIDVLCVNRESSGSDMQARRVLTTFLNNMDGVNAGNNKFVIVGMTNYLENIDNAMRRPGRFDLEIEVPVPNAKNRLQILKHLLNSVEHTITNEQLDQINDFCQAFVGADLKLLLTNSTHCKINRLNNSNNTSDDVSISDTVKAPENVDNQIDKSLTYEDMMNGLKVTRPSAMRELYVEVPEVRWDDIGGYEDLKSVIKQCVEYPRKFSNLYQKLQIQVPKGILLYGPPGMLYWCSKTLMAKAICTESHMNFISVRGPEIFDKYVGESERRLRRLFSKARLNSPCVIFFDEIDSICCDDSSSVSKRVLSTLLNELDGVSALKHVLVVAATNRPQDLNRSLLRPGRFDRLIYVPLPDFEARKAIFQLNLRKVKLDFDLEEAAESLAKLTEGYSGAEVVNICKQASLYLLNDIINSSSHKRLDEVIPLSYSYLEKALKNSKPMTSPELISFYEEYQNLTHF
uniref:Aaa family ATPase, putative n=1 Tax=Theileria annulata TaxID=5874 RepID=A0A3B0MRN5_THEAN